MQDNARSEARAGWRIGAATLVVGLIVLGLSWGVRERGAEPSTDTANAGPETATAKRPEMEIEVAKAAATPPTAPEPEPGPAATEQADGRAAPAEVAAAEKPSLDVVRVAPDGQSVVAGRAAPGSSVTIRADEAAVAEVEADAEGNFVAVFRAAPSAEARALTLEAKEDGGAVAVGEDVVVLLPGGATETAEQAGEAVAAASEAPDAGPGEGVATAETGEAAAAEGEAEPTVAAAAILRDGAIEVQPVARPRDADTDDVSIASISYAEAGEVRLAGFGLAGSELRAYVDDRFAQDGFVDASGRWALDLGDVAEGIYRLRIDQIGTDGAVASRIETPFQRDKPRPRPRLAGESGVAVIVQPGNNLWTLARIHYGSGVLYSQIFTANRDLIRDPDLIYPGQIFALPEVEAN